MEIMEFKDYFVFIIWVIGNEFNLWVINFKVWDVVNQIFEFIYEVDLNYFIIFMLVGIDKQLVDDIKQ